MVKTLSWEEACRTLRLPALEGNLFSSPDWLGVLYQTYRLSLFVKYIERDGQVASYIVYSVVRNFLEWKICLCSYCDYCDGYVQSQEDWEALFESLRQDFPDYRIAVRNLRDAFVRQVPQLKVLSTEKFHSLDLSFDEKQLWKQTHDSFKAAVKQSQRLGVVVKECPKSELAKFYHLHLQVRRRKYRIFAQPYRFFDIIWEQYIPKGKGVLLGAYDPQGRFIAGNIYLICGDTLYYKFNTSAHDALTYRPNNILFWEGMRYAKKKGLSCLDLGSSGNHQKGLILFKDHTGAQSREITHLGFTPPGYKFSEKKILKTFTRVFTHPVMPDFVVRWGGNSIYPFLA